MGQKRLDGHPLIRSLLGAIGILGMLCCGGCAIDGMIARGQIASRMSTPAVAGAGRMEIHDGMTVVHLYGTPREMGQQYGTLLGPSLRALERYENDFVPARFKWHLVAYARQHEKDLPPALLEELHAIADASLFPYMDLLVMNIVPRLACSGLSVWGDKSATGEMLMGRNSDYFSMGLYDRGMLVVVYHPTNGVAVASVNFLGMAGTFTGMNEHGVAFGNMLVFNAAGPRQSDVGLPIQLALRVAAQQATSSAEMVQILRSQQHVIPMNVMAADAREALVVELSPLGSEVRRGNDGALAASNHFRTEWLREYEEHCHRYESLISSPQNGPLGVAQMEKALYDARMKGLNVQAVVFEPAARRMHVSINHAPASAGPYITLDREVLFGASKQKTGWQVPRGKSAPGHPD